MWDVKKGCEIVVKEPVMYQLMTKDEYALLETPPLHEKCTPLLSEAVALLQSQSAAAVAIKDACAADLFDESAHSGKEEPRDPAAEVNFITVYYFWSKH